MRHIIKDLRMAIAVLVKSQHKEKLDDREADIIKAIISHKKVNKNGIKLLILFVIVYSIVLFAYNFEDITASALYNIKYYDQLSDVYLYYIENADQPESNVSADNNKVKMYTLLYNNGAADAVKSSNRTVLKCILNKQYKEMTLDSRYINNMTNALLQNGYEISESNLRQCESGINTIFNSNNYSIYNAVEKRHLSGVVILLMIINSPVAVLVYIVLLAVIILKLFNSISLYRIKKIVILLFLIAGLIYAFAGYILPGIVLSILLKMQAVVMLETVIVQVISQILTGCICCIIFNVLYKKYCKIIEWK